MAVVTLSIVTTLVVYSLSGTPVPTLAGILSGALLANLAFKDLLR